MKKNNNNNKKRLETGKRPVCPLKNILQAFSGLGLWTIWYARVNIVADPSL